MEAAQPSVQVSEDLRLALGFLSRRRAQMALASLVGRRPRAAPRRTDREAEPVVAPSPRMDLSSFFFALSAEPRRAILCLLEMGEHNVSEIVSHFELSQPTMSRHLSVLKKANLVADRRVGQNVVYSLARENLARAAVAFFGGFQSREDWAREVPQGAKAAEGPWRELLVSD